MKNKVGLVALLSASLFVSSITSVKAEVINEDNLGVVYIYNEVPGDKTNIATIEANGSLIYKIVVKCPDDAKRYKFVGYSSDGSEYCAIDDLDSTFVIRDIDVDKGTYQFYVMESGVIPTPQKVDNNQTKSNNNEDDDDDADDGDNIDDLIKQYTSNINRVHTMSNKVIAGVGGVYKVKVLAYDRNDVEFEYKYGDGEKVLHGTDTSNVSTQSTDTSRKTPTKENVGVSPDGKSINKKAESKAQDNKQKDSKKNNKANKKKSKKKSGKKDKKVTKPVVKDKKKRK